MRLPAAGDNFIFIKRKKNHILAEAFGGSYIFQSLYIKTPSPIHGLFATFLKEIGNSNSVYILPVKGTPEAGIRLS
jgi:hypothetical protein